MKNMTFGFVFTLFNSIFALKFDWHDVLKSNT